MKKFSKLFQKLALVMVVVIGIGALGSGIGYAYTHSMLRPWGDSYQTCTFKVQNTFGSLTKTQIADAMIHWNGQLTKSFLYKSSADTTETGPSRNGEKTVTKGVRGEGAYLAAAYAYYNWTRSHVVEMDIDVNTSHPWANAVKPGYYDVQSVITHELGHVVNGKINWREIGQ